MGGGGGFGQDGRMLPDSLEDWRGPLLALLVALGWAAGFRRRPGVAELALPLGALLGCALVLGVVAAPRTLPERLPWLLAGALALAVPLAFIRARVLAALVGGVAALAGAWWLAGAPAAVAEAARATPALLAAALLMAVLMTETQPRVHAHGAALLGAALVVLAAPPGPWVPLALVLPAAALGALPAGRAPGLALRMPLALGLGAVLLGPVLARGAPADWLAALLAPGALLLAPRLAGRAGPALAFGALALVALGLAFLLRLA